MSLDIQIKVDPTQAVAGAKQTREALAQAEAQGERVARAMNNLGGSFKAMAQAARLQLGATLGQTARAFDGLTEAIRREEVMLERIHGPARRYAEDLQVLDSLHMRGKISTREYADQVANLNRQIERTQQIERSASSGAPRVGATAMPSGQLSSIAANVGAINFKQAAQGAGQAFELLNANLKITESRLGSAIGSAIKFGAAGAQIAGPWGAAIGSVAGVVSDLIGKFDDGSARLKAMLDEERKLAKEYWESKRAAEARKRVEEELAPAMAEHARLASEIAEREAAANRVMGSSTDAYRIAAAEAQAYAQQLQAVNIETRERLRLEGKIPGLPAITVGTGGPQGLEDMDEARAIRAARGERDAIIRREAATKSYGQTLASLALAENARNDRLRDLEQIMGDVTVGQDIQKRALEEYNRLLKQTVGLEEKRAKLTPLQQLRADHDKAAKEALRRLEQEQRINIASQQPSLEADMAAFDLRNQPQPAARNLLTEKWMRDLQAIQQRAIDVRETLAGGFSSMATEIAQMAASGKASFEDMTSFMASKMIELISSQAFQALGRLLTGAIGGPSGAATIPGFATGGIIHPGGSGGTDSQLIMFRKSPNETVRINTPQQEAAYRSRATGGNGGGTQVLNITVGANDIVRSLEGPDGRRTILRVITQAFPQLRTAGGRG